jgi:hypothetical protein
MKVKESLIDQILENIVKMDLQDFIVTGGSIGSPRLGELEHSPEIIAMTEYINSKKHRIHRRQDAKKEKIVITLEIELQEK